MSESMIGRCGCGAGSVRTLGAVEYCDDCAEEFLAPLRARHGCPRIGRGRRAGRLRPEYGAGWCHLSCDTCAATWVGPGGERCEYCRRQLDNMRRWQAELVVMAPEYDLDDPRREPAMLAWAGRLKRAVAAELIDAAEADRVWSKEVRRGNRCAA